MSKKTTPIRILTYDAVYGLVDYGSAEYNPDKIEWLTKERCKVCGAAWLAENHIDGHYTCPKCGASKKGDILHIR